MRDDDVRDLVDAVLPIADVDLQPGLPQKGGGNRPDRAVADDSDVEHRVSINTDAPLNPAAVPEDDPRALG